MKKILNRTLSIVLSLAICMSLFCGVSLVSATQVVEETIEVNALEGLLPVAFYQITAQGAIDGTIPNFLVDYPNVQGDIDSFLEYWDSKSKNMRNITDGDKTTEMGNAVAYYNSTRPLYIVYKLDCPYDLNKIEVEIPASKTSNKQFNVYASTSREGLLESTPVVVQTTTKATSFSYDINVEAKYVAIEMLVDESWSFNIAELSAYGVQAGEINLAQHATPVAAYSANGNPTTYAWSNTIIGGTENAGNGQYMEWASASKANLVTRFPKISLLNNDVTTDSTQIYSKEWSGKGYVVVLAYKLNALTNLKQLGFIGTTSGADVYAARSKASLFHSSSKVGSFASGETVEVKFEDAKTALYIGFVLTGVNTINEITVYGDEVSATEQETVLGGIVPTNANANDKTKSFYQYLANVGGQDSILSGAHIYSINTNVNSSMEDNYYSYIERTYGISPSIVSISKPNLFSDADNYSEQTDIFADYYENGAIPMFMGLTDWHTDSTFGGIRYLDNTYEPTTEEQENLAADYLDAFDTKLMEWGDFFQRLEEAGVETYIFRPFAEMNTRGFFGDKGNTQFYINFINVWQQMYDYFYNVRGLKGLLIAWAPSGTESNIGPDLMSYYPGDEYVDIIAPTVYSTDGTGALPKTNNYEELEAIGKPIGISECAPRSASTVAQKGDCLELLNSIKQNYSRASFINLWFGQAQYGIDANENAEEFITSDYLVSIQNQANHQIDMIQPEAKAVLHSDVSLGGTAAKITAGAFNVADLGDVGMISIDLNDGMKITLYADADCTGEEWVFGKDLTDISDIAFNSFKIEICEEYTTGDINADGKFDLKDLVRMKKYKVGLSEASVLACDLDYSGRVDANDMVALQEFIISELFSKS